VKGRRIVITGCGAISPVGIGVSETWENLLEGVPGGGPITIFDASDQSVRLAAEVKDWDPSRYFEPKDARKMDRFTQFGVAAAAEAIERSGLTVDDPSRVGAIIGSGIGGMIIYEKQHEALLKGGPRRVSPFFIPMMIGDMVAGLVSIRHGLKGPNYCTVSACASGANAIVDAAMMIGTDVADAMVCGGSEATITSMAVAGFSNMKALSSRNDTPGSASRPFDKTRDGFVIGEGAGIVVLEEAERAKARGATILAEVTGWGLSADAFHMTAPAADGSGAASAMRQALKCAELDPSAIDYINAHGTSTPLNDKIEVRAVKEVFKDHAYKLKMGSTKSMTGHLLGAAGGLEAVICALAIQSGRIPPTINLEEPDPDCDLDHVSDGPVKMDLQHVLTNSFGFGGHNVALILSRYQN
jgi:3-oxoacyl-[acyl-carrier-protein] synthase II